jgi:hypothetical protein
VTDPDLDFSGFQAERKVDVPPPQKKKSPAAPSAPKPSGKKGKKGKKKKKGVAEKAPPGETPLEPVSDPKPIPVPKPAARPKAPAKARTGRKKRVNVSIPVELSQQFTERAAQEDRYLTDMVLDAYRDHFAEMRDRYLAEQAETDLPFRPRRRKAATGRVTHMLYLAAPEIAVIDGSAAEIGMSRSELVSQLIELDLA